MTMTSDAPFTRVRRELVLGELPSAPPRALLAPPPTAVHESAGPRRRVERAVLRRALAHIDGVELREQVGGALPVPRATTAERHRVVVRDGRAWSAVARDGSAGLGEAWFRGWWHTDDLVGFLRCSSATWHTSIARGRVSTLPPHP